MSTVQSPSTFLNSPCHHYSRPIIDTLLINKPYHIHLAMDLRAESKQNQIRSSDPRMRKIFAPTMFPCVSNTYKHGVSMYPRSIAC